MASSRSQALMNVNTRLRELYPDSEELFDIVLMTNNHAQVGVRLINSINYYGTLKSNIRFQHSDVSEGLRLFFHPFRFDHREVLYDRRQKSNRLPEGLPDESLPLQRF